MTVLRTVTIAIGLALLSGAIATLLFLASRPSHLERVFAHLRPGMTIDDVSAMVGQPSDDEIQALSHPDRLLVVEFPDQVPLAEIESPTQDFTNAVWLKVWTRGGHQIGAVFDRDGKLMSAKLVKASGASWLDRLRDWLGL